jgi:hypothetical protein
VDIRHSVAACPATPDRGAQNVPLSDNQAAAVPRAIRSVRVKYRSAAPTAGGMGQPRDSRSSAPLKRSQGRVPVVRGGKPVAFLSCSEAYRKAVAEPIKEALGKLGVDAIIASVEPLPPNADWDPATKIDKLLDQSDCVVVLGTPDDERSDGTFATRPNIIDEISRARARQNLRTRTMVLKTRNVQLHSNVNPTYETLTLEDPTAVTKSIVTQMTAWGILDGTDFVDQLTASPTPDPADSLTPFLDGLRLGDHDEADRRAFKVVIGYYRAFQQLVVSSLFELLINLDPEDERLHPAMSLLEAFLRLDHSLLDLEALERLGTTESSTKRSSAATILWDLALSAPGEVPLGLLGRFAQPNHEDWYVQAPAMAAAKELLLVRPQTRSIFDDLLMSDDADDRRAVGLALIDVAKVDGSVIPDDVVTRLCGDSDEEVSRQGIMLRELVAETRRNSYRIRHFGL